ncbi:MAG: MarR family transcriptional regulator [Candidatus Velthaea sp.]|jgi:DNA-binding MarR family transcriptional regulator
MRQTSPAVSPVLPLDRAACACAIVRRAAREVTHLYDAALAPTGLRITQYSLLANLDRHGAIAMSDLADVLGMDRTTLTRNLAPLERDGLLSLRPAGRGRTKLVNLTDRGRRDLRAAFPYWEQAQQQLDAAGADGPVRGLLQMAQALRRGRGERDR